MQLVVLMDPVDETDDILRQNRSREKQFMFDLALDGQSTQVTRLLIPRQLYSYRRGIERLVVSVCLFVCLSARAL